MQLLVHNSWRLPYIRYYELIFVKFHVRIRMKVQLTKLNAHEAETVNFRHHLFGHGKKWYISETYRCDRINQMKVRQEQGGLLCSAAPDFPRFETS